MGWESDKDNDVIENRSVEDDNTGSKDYGSLTVE